MKRSIEILGLKYNYYSLKTYFLPLSRKKFCSHDIFRPLKSFKALNFSF